MHAWRAYHVQPNPIAMNRAHPAYPPTESLMRTNYSVSHTGPRDGVGTPDESGAATRKVRLTLTLSPSLTLTLTLTLTLLLSASQPRKLHVNMPGSEPECTMTVETSWEQG